MRKSNLLSILGMVIPGLFLCTSLSAEEGSDTFVAGVNPAQRPENAPVIQEFKKERVWYDRAVTGIIPPFPASFSFLDDQEAWYTPFNNPGMLARYDIRNWHAKKAK
jgi:hypothetical protein